MTTWDWAASERRKPVKEPRAVVSVAFPRSQMDLISRAAEAQGVYTSSFVRRAALDRARRVLGETERPAPAGFHTIDRDGARGGERLPFGGDYTRTFVSGHMTEAGS